MKKLIAILITCGSLLSCEKGLLDKNPDSDPRANFESLWETVGDKYAFFELKGLDWDSVYSHYSPQVTPATTDEELFTILDSMLYDLRDGHVNLISPFNMSRNWSWYLEYPLNFSNEVVEREYLGENYRIAGGLRYTIIDDIGYIYYGSFSSGFSHQNLDEVMNFMKGTKGLIVDVRNNGGGVLNNAFALSQRLVDRERMALITYEKTGPGPTDFGKGLSYNIGPSEHINYNGPVLVLTNRRSYSATNTFAAIMRGYDNVTLIGAPTGGGGGIPVDFELPNGWNYRFSATISVIPDGSNGYYNIEVGVPPHITAAAPAERLAQGVDDIIDSALQYLQ